MSRAVTQQVKLRGAESRIFLSLKESSFYRNFAVRHENQQMFTLFQGCTCAMYRVYTKKNGAASKVNKIFISHLTRAQTTPSAAATVQVSHVLPAVRFSCLLRGRGASFQDGVAVGKGFLCAPF